MTTEYPEPKDLVNKRQTISERGSFPKIEEGISRDGVKHFLIQDENSDNQDSHLKNKAMVNGLFSVLRLIKKVHRGNEIEGQLSDLLYKLEVSVIANLLGVSYDEYFHIKTLQLSIDRLCMHLAVKAEITPGTEKTGFFDIRKSHGIVGKWGIYYANTGEKAATHTKVDALLPEDVEEKIVTRKLTDDRTKGVEEHDEYPWG